MSRGNRKYLYTFNRAHKITEMGILVFHYSLNYDHGDAKYIEKGSNSKWSRRQLISYIETVH